MKTRIGLPFMLGLFLVFLSCKKDGPVTLQYGKVTDIDGNVYKTIKIGDQEWMAENLRVTHYNTGTAVQDEIPLVLDEVDWGNLGVLGTGIYCYYDKDLANMSKYGALYNWYAVNTGKLAPAGWHVATDADWKKLQDYLMANGYSYDGNEQSGKIAKSLAAQSGWNPDQNPGNVGNNQASNNKTGFNILPGGFRHPSGTFDGLGSMGFLKVAGNPINYWGVNANSPFLHWSAIQVGAGLPVRCVKD